MSDASTAALEAGNLPYAAFGSTLGDNYPKCDPEVMASGRVFAVSYVGKDLTEAICRRLRDMGYSADWHAINNSVALKTLDSGEKLAGLNREWRRQVRKALS